MGLALTGSWWGERTWSSRSLDSRVSFHAWRVTKLHGISFDLYIGDFVLSYHFDPKSCKFSFRACSHLNTVSILWSMIILIIYPQKLVYLCYAVFSTCITSFTGSKFWRTIFPCGSWEWDFDWSEATYSEKASDIWWRIL